jgi:hypothetical protein
MIMYAIIKFFSQIFGSVEAHATKIATNVTDFGVYIPTVTHITATVDNALRDEPFIGHLFASSDMAGMICKVKYIMELGYLPIHGTAEVKDGDTVKGSSFWGDYQTEVIDSSASIMVNYGEFHAYFEDVIFVKNDGTIKGGWSGSGFRLLS